jgi:hypothetical protein
MYGIIVRNTLRKRGPRVHPIGCHHGFPKPFPSKTLRRPRCLRGGRRARAR